MADFPLLPQALLDPLLALVESASAVATADAAAAVVGLVAWLDAEVEVAEAVGDETALGGLVDGTELSLVPASAVVGCLLLEVSLEALDGVATRGVFGVANELVEHEVEEPGGGGDRGVQDFGEPSAGLRATGVSAEEETTFNSKKAWGMSQHLAFSSANPQQNLAANPKVWLRS